ncbi:hypothetical protein CUMW_185820 [Citrus unshiu]|nr:hypothetical protein CUMW_185820 [Citrus unshiu]
MDWGWGSSCSLKIIVKRVITSSPSPTICIKRHSGLCKSNNAALNLKAILDLTLRKKAWKESSLDF